MLVSVAAYCLEVSALGESVYDCETVSGLEIHGGFPTISRTEA